MTRAQPFLPMPSPPLFYFQRRPGLELFTGRNILEGRLAFCPRHNVEPLEI